MLFLVFLLYVAVSFVHPAEIFPVLAPYRLTFWIGIVGLGFAAFRVAIRRTSLITPQAGLLLAFTIALTVSLMIVDRWLGAPLYVMRRFGPALTMFILAAASVDSLRKLRIVASWVTILSLALVTQGIAAYYFGYKANIFLFDPVTRLEYSALTTGEDVQAEPGTPNDDEAYMFEEFEGSDVVRIRGLGLLHDPNDLALALVMVVPMVGAAWRSRKMLRNLLWVVGPGIIIAYGIYLTHSRGGALAFAATLWFASLRRAGPLKSLVLLVGLLTAVVAADVASGRTVLAVSDESAVGRVTAWTEGLEMLKMQPFIGIGYGQFLDYHTLTAHNSLVLCFAETGVIGYFFWAGLLVVTFLQLRELRMPHEDHPLHQEFNRWGTILQLSLIGFLTAGFFLSRTFIPMLYLILGLSGSLLWLARKEQWPFQARSLMQWGAIVLGFEIGTILAIYAIVKLHILS